MGLEEVFVVALGAEGGGLGPSAEGVVLQAGGEVGGAAKGEVDLLADDPALGAGLAEDGDEDAALALLGVDGVRGVGEIEERDIEQMEDGVFGACLVLVEREVGGGKDPVGIGEQAGGHGAVVDVVGAGAGFDHELAGEEKRVGRDEASAAGGPGGGGRAVQADGAGDVVEAAGAGLEVVGGVRGGDVLVVFAAGEADVAGGGGLVGVLVVGEGVGAEEVVGVGDLDLIAVRGVAGEEIGAAVFGLEVGGPGDGFGNFFRRLWGGARDLGEVELEGGLGRGGQRCRVRHLRAEEMWMQGARGDDRQEEDGAVRSRTPGHSRGSL